MTFTAEELDLIFIALSYTTEHGYTFRDDPEIEDEYQRMINLMHLMMTWNAKSAWLNVVDKV